MLSIRMADATQTRRWRVDLEKRLEDWYGRLGATNTQRSRLRGWDTSPGELHMLSEDGRDIGCLALTHQGGVASVYDLWIEPDSRGKGYGRQALRYAQLWATDLAATAGGPRSFGAQMWTDDPALAVLFADCPLRSQKMIKKLPTAVQLPEGIIVRPLAEDEYAEWLANEIVGYAADLTDSGSLPRAEAEANSRQAYVDMLPNGTATPGQTIWMIEALGLDGPDGARPVASVWLGEHVGPDLSYVFAVEARPEYRGRGFGKAAMLAAEDRSLAAGDSYLGLNVFGHNTVAMNLYHGLGYAIVDQVRTRPL